MVIQLQEFLRRLDSFGITDVALPFFLVFALVYGTLTKTKLLGEKKGISVVVAVVMGLLFVVPHVTHSYPNNFDPVQLLNDVIPSFGLAFIIGFAALLILTSFGTESSSMTNISWGLGFLVMVNLIVHFKYPSIFGVVLALSGVAILNRLLMGEGAFISFAIVLALGVVYMFVRHGSNPGPLPSWLAFTENSIFQSMIVTIAVIAAVISWIGKGEE